MKRREAANPYYPVMLNVQGKKCLVVGGGAVALRKTQMLIDHGAEVVIVSPMVCPELDQLAKSGTVQTVLRAYETKDLSDTLLVVAATDDVLINQKVAAEARKRRLLVNVVDKPGISDFIIPSYFKRGDIIVAVSTSGKSPALARKIRGELENELRAEYVQLAVIASDVRDELKKNGVAVSAEDWQAALDLNSLVELIKRGKNKEAKEIMLAKLMTATQRKP